MAGFPPPPDAPPLGAQISLSLSLSFDPGLSGFSLCGFTIPGFSFSLSFSISLLLLDFDFPPSFFFALGLICDLVIPLSLSLGPGGGRAGAIGLEVDLGD